MKLKLYPKTLKALKALEEQLKQENARMKIKIEEMKKRWGV